MLYAPKFTFSAADAINLKPPYAAPTGLLVGTDAVLSFIGAGEAYGYKRFQLYPAFHEGQRKWLRHTTWVPSPGYTAQGEWDRVIGYGEGAALVWEHAVARMFQEAKYAERATLWGGDYERSVADALRDDWRESEEVTVDEGEVAQLYVGEAITSWEAGHNETGHWHARLSPGFLRGQACWVRRSEWRPAPPYIDHAVHEVILPIAAGLQQAVTHEAFFWPSEWGPEKEVVRKREQEFNKWLRTPLAQRPPRNKCEGVLFRPAPGVTILRVTKGDDTVKAGELVPVEGL